MRGFVLGCIVSRRLPIKGANMLQALPFLLSAFCVLSSCPRPVRASTISIKAIAPPGITAKASCETSSGYVAAFLRNTGSEKVTVSFSFGDGSGGQTTLKSW